MNHHERRYYPRDYRQNDYELLNRASCLPPSVRLLHLVTHHDATCGVFAGGKCDCHSSEVVEKMLQEQDV